MSTRTKLILGILGAAAAGVAIGMLLAPEAGSDTRKRIASTTSDWSNSLGDIFSNARQGLGNLTQKGSRAATDVAKRYS